MKKIALFLSIFTLVMLNSCKKEDKVVYELTLIAKKPSIGTTTFSDISYHNGAQLQTITNSSSDFETTFAVPKNFNVIFSAKGTTTVPAGTSGTPIPIMSYQLTEIVNDDSRTTLCSETNTSVMGSNGKFTFSASFNKIFDGLTCK